MAANKVASAFVTLRDQKEVRRACLCPAVLHFNAPRTHRPVRSSALHAVRLTRRAESAVAALAAFKGSGAKIGIVSNYHHLSLVTLEALLPLAVTGQRASPTPASHNQAARTPALIDPEALLQIPAPFNQGQGQLYRQAGLEATLPPLWRPSAFPFPCIPTNCCGFHTNRRGRRVCNSQPVCAPPRSQSESLIYGPWPCQGGPWECQAQLMEQQVLLAAECTHKPGLWQRCCFSPHLRDQATGCCQVLKAGAQEEQQYEG
eukprot:306178-Pelagomonas_calceolata.AAC.1